MPTERASTSGRADRRDGAPGPSPRRGLAAWDTVEKGSPRVGPVASFVALESDWRRLATRSGSVFATWEWATVWWELYGGRGRLCLLPVSDSAGDVIGILPLYVQRRLPINVARFVGHEGGDEVGPVCAPEHRAVVAAALRDGARLPELGADLILAESLPAADWESHLSSVVVLRRSTSPSIDLEGHDWDSFLRTLSRKMRREIAHGERRLHREHRVTYRVTQDPARLEHDMDTFFALHRARFGRASSLAPRETFYRRFAAVALERGWLRLAVLELDGIPAAARLDLRFAGVHFAYNAGRHPGWNRISVGLLLRAMTIRDAIEEGVTEYRLLRGGEPYKYRLATEDRGSLAVAIPATLGGRLAVAGAAQLVRSGWGRGLLNRAIGS